MSAIRPSVFPGRTHTANKGAIDWGWQNLVCFASHSYVIVMDPISLRIVQTLDEHNQPVTALKWRPNDALLAPERDGNALQIISADLSGLIILWNVLGGAISRTFRDETNSAAVVQLGWLPKCPKIVVALHKNCQLVAWDADTGVVQWRLSFPDEIVSFSTDPFSTMRMCFGTSSGWVYFADGPAPYDPPTITQKFRISPLVDKKNTKATKTQQDLKQVVFYPAQRSIIYFVMNREILVFDLRVNQSIGTIVLDRGRGAFSRMIPSYAFPNLSICLHENGSVSAWNRHSTGFHYEMKAIWEMVRVNNPSQWKKNSSSIMGIVSGQIGAAQNRFILVSTDGTVWSWEYNWMRPEAKNAHPAADRPLLRIHSTRDKFTVRGMVEHLPSPVRREALPEGKGKALPLVAIGTFSGNLQIINPEVHRIEREFSISSQPLRCVRWISKHDVITFSCEEQGDTGYYKSYLYHIDLRTGRVDQIRKDSEHESTFIRTIKLSHSRNYFIVLLKDRPFELWSASTLSLVRAVSTTEPISSLCWCPTIKRKQTGMGIKTEEKFVLTSPGGQFHYYAVENSVVAKSRTQTDNNVGVVSSISWKANHLVTGDTNGNVHCIDFDKRTSRTFATHLGVVRRIQFTPGPKCHICVLFKDGDFAIWDLDNGVRLSSSSYLKGRNIRAVDIDWVSESNPIVACNDGAVRILDRSLSGSNSVFDQTTHLVHQKLNKPLFSPHLLELKRQWVLRAILEEGRLDLLPTFVLMPSLKNSTELLGAFDLPPLLLGALKALSNKTPDRVKAVAEYFGDQHQITFWTLASNVLERFAKKDQPQTSAPEVDLLGELPEPRDTFENDVTTPTPVSQATEEATDLELPGGGSEESVEAPHSASQKNLRGKSLPLYYDVLCEPEDLQAAEQMFSDIEHNQRSSYQLTKQNIYHQIVLGNKSSVIEMLLETPTSDPNFFQDALKACVVAASLSPASFESTVRMVAGHLMSRGDIEEGIQLLILIGKGADACQFLQSCDRWDDALWLAKLTTTESECAKIVHRWCDQLVDDREYRKATLLLLSLGRFPEVLQILHEMGDFHGAAMFYRACIEAEALPPPNLIPAATSTSDRRRLTMSRDMLPLETLVQSIYIDYGFSFHRAGESRMAKDTWQKAGDAGEKMIERFLRHPKESPIASLLPESEEPSSTSTSPSPSMDDLLNADIDDLLSS